MSSEINSRSETKCSLFSSIIFFEYITFHTEGRIESCLLGLLPNILIKSFL